MLSDKSKQAIRDVYQNIRDSLPDFAVRRSQNILVAEMAKTLAGNFDKNRRLIIAEAGTGTGKSLAYLIAGIPLATEAKKTLVISTATIALQEQLLHKELPFFRRQSGLKFEFALVKGRQRYCCEQKLAMLSQADDQIELLADLATVPKKRDLQLIKRMFTAYAAGKWKGDIDSWPTQIPDDIWQLIVSDRHSCSKSFSAHRNCPFHKAREALDQCDVLIVNHALLLADLELGGGIILPKPEDCYYVLDEAHHLPRITRDFSSAHASVLGAKAWLQTMAVSMRQLTQAIASSEISDPVTKLLSSINTISKELTKIHSLMSANDRQFSDDSWRFADGELPEALAELAANMNHETKRGVSQTAKIVDILAEQVKQDQLPQVKANKLIAEVGFYLQRIENLHQVWNMLIKETKGTPLAKWVEKSGSRQDDHIFAASLIDVDSKLEHMLWSQCGAAILTSATLTSLGNFNYFRRQVGLLNDESTQHLRLDSPFEFEQAELYIPNLALAPNEPGFTELLAEKLPSLLPDKKASLVLFSSYRQMNQVAEIIRNTTKLELLVQKESSRTEQLQKHAENVKANKTSILFGTSSLSEGLDLPGDLLTNLIITKIPFSVPTSPVEEAQSEWITKSGGNPFMQVSVPEASKKLIQSCGRLLRKEKDSGRITLLDRRVISKRYGPALLNSLPPYKRNIEF
ncbi:ATP-dependent helicase DinG/Rad3 [Moritella sp. JT01]|uniref:ATP-dependent DNA helicase DinG n=1 Tax=Moritella sp. JT01 TaxID=756698 RepID=UPI000796F360|nr:ATP-dependent DNA helicase DinG [Moritella sp. JT01]KXO12923.1 ATP-dependent helicase DinG/Rad3 [Moritella sp. JT01]